MSILAVLKEIADETTEPKTSCVAQVAKDPAPSSSLTLDHVASEFFTEDERRAWLVLVLNRPEKFPLGSIIIGPRVGILDVAKFVEATIQDLTRYVSAKNRRDRHWVDRVLDEKLGQLTLCGVTTEIRRIQ